MPPQAGAKGDVALAFGERPDGSIVHVGTVKSGLACDCRCPGCGVRLVARKGPVKEHHFAHYNSVPCRVAVETALHKLAKQILNQRRELLIPEVAVDVGDEREVGSPAQMFHFDRAELETPEQGFIPDVVLYKGDRRLIIEVYVTHLTGALKRQRIALTDVSALEIDLSKVPRDASEEQIADAICRHAPRHWLHNTKHAALTLRLEERLAQKARRTAQEKSLAAQRAEARIRTLADTISIALRRPASWKRASSSAVARVKQTGLADQAQQVIPGDQCFAAPRLEWQAAILDAGLIGPLLNGTQSYQGVHASEIYKRATIKAMLKPGIPDFISKPDTIALATAIAGYQSPYQVVETYLGRLAAGGLLTVLNKRFYPTDLARQRIGDHRAAQQAYVTRRQQVTATIESIISKLPQHEVGRFTIGAWLAAAQPGLGGSPDEALRSGEAGTYRLIGPLTAAEKMMFMNGPIIANLLGLPLEQECRRRAESRAEKARADALARENALAAAAVAKKAADRNARMAREHLLQETAFAELSTEARDWLAQPLGDLNDLTPFEAARSSAGGLDQALASLRIAGSRRRRQLDAEHWRGCLIAAAQQTPKPDHARLFLNSPHPKWGQAHPLDCCIDERSFIKIRDFMLAMRHP